jgi:hypothetical protein
MSRPIGLVAALVAPVAQCRAGLLVALTMVGVGTGPATARATDESAPKTPPWFEELALDGFVSTSWSYNRNAPDSRTNRFRVFDFDDNSFKLDVFEMVAQVPVAKPRDAGFRVDLAVGSSVPRVTASAGLFRDASGAAQDLDLQQAFASWIAPVGAGLRLEVGKFITFHGYEVIEGYDGWNDNATRSILFGYAIPFTHVGTRATYAFSPRVSGMAMVVNGCDVAVDNNRSKTVGAQLTLMPTPALTVWLNGMAGPERPNSETDSRDLFDVVAIWKASPRLTLGVNTDLGREPHAALDGGDATWAGVAGYARLGVRDDLALILRGEAFDDGDGARTGVAQRLTEFTFTPEVRLTRRALLRVDLRLDRSSQDVFEKRDGATDTQGTGTLNLLFSF